MDDCLTNRCRVDEAKIRAAARLTTRTQRYLDFIFAALVIAAGIYNVLRLLKAGASGFSPVIGTAVLFGLGIFLIRDAFTVADRSVKLSMERRRKEGIPEDLEFIFRFGPAEMELENSCTRQPSSLSYDQIESILRSGAEFQLHLRNNMYYILDPVRFENGIEADFWRLMNEKCPKAVPRKFRHPANP